MAVFRRFQTCVQFSVPPLFGGVSALKAGGRVALPGPPRGVQAIYRGRRARSPACKGVFAGSPQQEPRGGLKCFHVCLPGVFTVQPLSMLSQRFGNINQNLGGTLSIEPQAGWGRTLVWPPLGLGRREEKA